ncbi:MAG TPA: ABC transporter permease [Nitrososphaerales archaeon]|nr:ABC transporter permease [Nitrososphaerales archaeon]
MSGSPNSVRLAWRNLRVNMDPSSLVIIIGLPAMYLVFMGTMFVSVVPPFLVNGVTFEYKSYLTPGIIAFQTVMAGTMGGSMLWIDRRMSMFSQILSGPFTRTQYLMGVIIATTAASIAGAVIMMLIAAPIGATLSFSLLGLGLVLLNLIVGGVFFCSLLLFIAAKVDSNQAYNSIQILILFVINFVSDVFYPITSQTPYVLRIFSYINPLTYISDGIRAGLSDPSSILLLWNPVETVVLVVETIVMFLLAYFTYTKVKVGRA